MTDAERQQAFLNALDALSQQHGFAIRAQVQAEQLGPVWQARAVVVLVPVEDWTPPAADETRPCPVCGKLMIKRWSDAVIDVFPPVHSWHWWCAADGHTESGGSVQDESDDAIARKRWEAVNDKDKA